MEEGNYVIRGQKLLRSGYTTGTCAAAAAKAATFTYLTGKTMNSVSVNLPKGGAARIDVHRVSSNEYFVVKDAGDDPDVTNRCEVHAEVSFADRIDVPEHAFSDSRYSGIVLTGGQGVGTVTKPGLSQNVGESAINKVPREMIFGETAAVFEELDLSIEEAMAAKPGTSLQSVINDHEILIRDKSMCDSSYTQPEYWSKDRTLVITISVPGGEEIAKKTFNPNLGIVGGISILGTSGIVDPMSEKALVDTIEVECRQVIAMGEKNLLFVPGNYGERYVRDELHICDVRMIQCSNYIGESIDIASALGASSILFVGNFGKLVKVAAGIMNTHSKVADARWEIVAAHAALAGASKEMLEDVRNSLTTDQMLKSLGEYREKTVESIIVGMNRHLKRRAKEIPVGAIAFSESYGYLGETEEADRLLRHFQKEGQRFN